MLILAIDPGTYESAYVIYDSDTKEILDKGKILNETMRTILRGYIWPADVVVIEMIASYGMAVGKEVFDTCLWAGRFFEIVSGKCRAELMYRKEVKLHLCGTTKANDSNIRKAILDLFEPTGGGAVPQIGTKGKPGPLYGVSKDIWAALAVAITYAERREK